MGLARVASLISHLLSVDAKLCQQWLLDRASDLLSMGQWLNLVGDASFPECIFENCMSFSLAWGHCCSDRTSKADHWLARSRASELQLESFFLIYRIIHCQLLWPILQQFPSPFHAVPAIHRGAVSLQFGLYKSPGRTIVLQRHSHQNAAGTSVMANVAENSRWRTGRSSIRTLFAMRKLNPPEQGLL